MKSKNVSIVLLLFSIMLTAACSSGDGSSVAQEVDVIPAAPPEIDTSVPVLSLSESAWPVIHQNNSGSKESACCGPFSAGASAQFYEGARPVLTLIGPNYLYFQAAQVPELLAFDPDDISSGPVFTTAVDGTFPLTMGGGLVDSQDNVWWIINGRVVRFDETLSSSTASDVLLATDGAVVKGINGLTLLDDGNLLVTSMHENAWIVSTTENEDGVFPVLQQINLQNFTSQGELIWEGETGFPPRPVTMGEGSVFLVGGDWLVKLAYDSVDRVLQNEVVWSFLNPAEASSNLVKSNPVLVGDKICVTGGPNGISEQIVYCLDQITGALIHTLTPFPGSLGVTALHTLGAIESTQTLFALGNDSSGGGGVTAFDLADGEPLWTASLNNISEAFAVEAQTHRLFIAHRQDVQSPFSIVSIDAFDGTVTTVFADSSLQGNPTGHLASLGPGGLYYPIPTGMVRLWE
jgi:outer membrane protein assembly factor BamB